MIGHPGPAHVGAVGAGARQVEDDLEHVGQHVPSSRHLAIQFEQRLSFRRSGEQPR